MKMSKIAIVVEHARIEQLEFQTAAGAAPDSRRAAAGRGIACGYL